MHNPPRLAFPALIVANLVLAAGPWLVRLCQQEAAIGPVAAGFWRLALALPFLAFIAVRQQRGQPFPAWTLVAAVAIGEPVMPQDWAPVIALSVSSQLIGQGLLVYAMGHLSPVVTGLCFLTQPIASAAIGWIAFQERLSSQDWIGALLICAALVLI